MIQEIATCLVVGGALLYTAFSVYSLFGRRGKKPASDCSGCSANGCKIAEIKRII
jgi:hypothetical protein